MSETVQIIGTPTTQITTSTLPYYPNAPVPQDLGYQGWTSDPAQTATSTPTTAGTLYLAAIPVRSPCYIQNLHITLTAAASGATPNQNWLGAYAPDGTMLGTPVDITNSLTTVGQPITADIGSQLLQAGWIWLAGTFNASTTQPQLASLPSTAFAATNGLLTTTAYRYTTNGTGLTTLPASINPADNSESVMIPYWGAMS
jgi:hypothetical protein